MSKEIELKELEKARVFLSNKLGTRNYQSDPKLSIFEAPKWMIEFKDSQLSSLKEENKALRKGIKAQKEYIEFIGEHYNSALQMAHIHGFRVSDADVKKGEELRAKIKSLLNKEAQ